MFFFSRMPNDSQVDVLTRKTYAALSGSRIRVVKDNKTGAKAEDDGELHMLINDAFGLRLPSGMRFVDEETIRMCLNHRQVEGHHHHCIITLVNTPSLQDIERIIWQQCF